MRIYLARDTPFMSHLRKRNNLVYKISEFYRMAYVDLCACPSIPGINTVNEKFPRVPLVY